MRLRRARRSPAGCRNRRSQGAAASWPRAAAGPRWNWRKTQAARCGARWRAGHGGPRRTGPQPGSPPRRAREATSAKSGYPATTPEQPGTARSVAAFTRNTVPALPAAASVHDTARPRRSPDRPRGPGSGSQTRARSPVLFRRERVLGAASARSALTAKISASSTRAKTGPTSASTPSAVAATSMAAWAASTKRRRSTRSPMAPECVTRCPPLLVS